MKLLLLVTLALSTAVFAADKSAKKNKSAAVTGEIKPAPTIDAAKDLPRYPAVEPAQAIGTWKVN
jgi:hypothetical protein